MQDLITSSYPHQIDYGAQDLSTRVVPVNYPGETILPTHIPLFYIMAPKGNSKKEYLTYGEITTKYGEKALDSLSPYYNHSSRYLLAALNAGANCVVKRVIPSTAYYAGNVLYAQVYQEKSTQATNTNTAYIAWGSYNSLGNGVVQQFQNTVTNLPGVNLDIQPDGLGQPVLNQLLPTANGFLPILSICAEAPGEYYNQYGFIIEPLLPNNIDMTLVNEMKSLMFKIYLFNKPQNSLTPNIIPTLYGNQYVLVSFKPNAINPNTTTKMDITNVINNNYWNETNSSLPLAYKEVSLYFYSQNYNTITTALANAEGANSNNAGYSDATIIGPYGMNPFTCTNTQGTAYTNVKKVSVDALVKMLTPPTPPVAHTQPATSPTGESSSSSTEKNEPISPEHNSKTSKPSTQSESNHDSKNNQPATTLKLASVSNQKQDLVNYPLANVEFNVNTPIFLTGGTDGLSTNLEEVNTEFETLVKLFLTQYSDPNSPVQDINVNPETHFYDSGYSVDTKQVIPNFLGGSKSHIVILSTYVQGQSSPSDLNTIIPLGEVLSKAIQVYPESQYFNTPTCRGSVVYGSMDIIENGDPVTISQSYDLLVKTCDMMSDETWNAQLLFDAYPLNVINTGTNCQPAFLPEAVKSQLWSTGGIYSEPFDLRSFFVPGYKTVYSNDTSVLNSYFTVCALANLTVVGNNCWKKFTGVSNLSDAELQSKIQAYCEFLLSGLYGGVVTVVPEVVLTEADILRGYSWHIIFKLYSGGMKSVCITQTQVYRTESLATPTTNQSNK